MKNIISIALFLSATNIYAQIPQAFNYQAVVRDIEGVPVKNDTIDFTIEILQTGSVVYSEIHEDINTNELGIVNFQVGMGDSLFGNFSNINWAVDQMKIKVTIDNDTMGIADIVPVPTALYAERSGGDNDWTVNNQDIFRLNGRVGIGNSSPAEKLDVNGDIKLSSPNSKIKGPGGEGRLNFYQNSGATDSRSWIELWGEHPNRQGELTLTGSYIKLRYGNTDQNNGIVGITLDEFGRVGIGTGNTPLIPDFKARIKGATSVGEPGDGNVLLDFRSDRPWQFRQLGIDAGTKLELKSIGGGGNKHFVINTDGNVGIKTGETAPQADLDVNGTTETCVLRITGGCDGAEYFDIKPSKKIEPGSLVIIDEENEGQLKISAQPYDQRVAGVISGAGGVKPGIVLEQEEVLEGNELVSLWGRVYVKATAVNGTIKPGDLLTSSHIPGHVMKATKKRKCRGAVIGKALSGLSSGEGLVMVLIQHQ